MYKEVLYLLRYVTSFKRSLFFKQKLAIYVISLSLLIAPAGKDLGGNLTPLLNHLSAWKIIPATGNSLYNSLYTVSKLRFIKYSVRDDLAEEDS